MPQITRRQIIRQIIERVLEAATLAESIGIKIWYNLAWLRK